LETHNFEKQIGVGATIYNGIFMNIQSKEENLQKNYIYFLLAT
jgi:hypothetical protein